MASTVSRAVEVGAGHPGELATFGAGCYWGTEHYFRNKFTTRFPDSIVDVRVGFMGGPGTAPSYEDVCSGATGHVEVAQLRFLPDKAPYEELVKFFFEFHDPTTANRQGNDRGTQYASVIFVHSDAQRAVAEAVKLRLNERVAAGLVPKFREASVSTEIRDASTFWEAHPEHQRYLENNPGGYCNHAIRPNVWE
eukprot:a340776_152.p1 GENE.a340776_152~~a340776_152.p1  ORF type:complete len:225 (+),score=51.54 a340776_152:96-677(+)